MRVLYEERARVRELYADEGARLDSMVNTCELP
jgi:hypothetical protein